MTAQRSEAAQAFLDAMKNAAQSVGDSSYNLTRTTKLRCRYKPNMSYGRLQEPVVGDEEFQWEWELWTREDALNAPEHLRADVRGWRGLPHEGIALRLLSGEPWADVKASLEAQGRELAERFS